VYRAPLGDLQEADSLRVVELAGQLYLTFDMIELRPLFLARGPVPGVNLPMPQSKVPPNESAGPSGRILATTYLRASTIRASSKEVASLG
jgi:hypothetical protein